MRVRYHLGADPGGASAFGVAILAEDGERAELLQSGVCDGVESALAWFGKFLKDDAPTSLGIDTLTYWRTGKSGWRAADRVLRESYRKLRNSVLSPNGLAGSMGIQGMALFLRSVEIWPDIRVTETHPKLLWHALFPNGPAYPRKNSGSAPESIWANESALAAVQSLMDKMALAPGPSAIDGEDAFDAVLSAVAAWKGSAGRWTCDLVAAEFHERGEEGRPLFPAGRPAYWWPEALPLDFGASSSGG